MVTKYIFLPVVAALAFGLGACQHKPGTDTADMPALDYPFDDQGNYIESAAQKMGTPSGRKPVTVAMNKTEAIPEMAPSVAPPAPPPPAPSAPTPVPDNNYQPMADTVPPPPTLEEKSGAGSGEVAEAKAEKPKTTSKPASKSTTKPKATTSYTVAKGDTLSEIARKYGTSVSAIRASNGLESSNMIRVGQKLKIPGAGKVVSTGGTKSSGGTKSTAGKSKASSSGGSYVVKSGDSLWVIARKNNTTVDALKQANGLSSENLQVGQKLKLP